MVFESWKTMLVCLISCNYTFYAIIVTCSFSVLLRSQNILMASKNEILLQWYRNVLRSFSNTTTILNPSMSGNLRRRTLKKRELIPGNTCQHLLIFLYSLVYNWWVMFHHGCLAVISMQSFTTFKSAGDFYVLAYNSA